MERLSIFASLRSPAFLVLLSGALLLSARAGEFEDLQSRFNTARKAAHPESEAEWKRLNGQLASALEKLQQELTDKGDLEGVRKIRDQRLSFLKDGNPAVITSADAGKHVAIYRRQAADLAGAEKRKLTPLYHAYFKRLDDLMNALTNSGNIDEAVKVATELKARRGEFAHLENIRNPSGDRPVDPAPDEGNPFSKSEWSGTMDIGPGRYRTRLGKISYHSGGNAVTMAGVDVAGIEVYADEGNVMAENCDFSEMFFTVDLGGLFGAKDCLFDECRFGKGGSGFVDRWSGKWRFSNSVFVKKFFNNGWHATDISIIADNCTFYGISMGRYGYKEAGADAADENLTFRKCRFIDCEIHETILLAMEDCAFEKCRIVPDEEGYPMETELARTFYLVAPKRSLPDFPSEFTATVLMKDSPEAGASLPHQYRGGGKLRRP